MPRPSPLLSLPAVGAVAGLQVGVPHKAGGAGVGEGVAPQVALDVLVAVGGVGEEETARGDGLLRARVACLVGQDLRARGGRDADHRATAVVVVVVVVVVGVDAGEDVLVPLQGLCERREARG